MPDSDEARILFLGNRIGFEGGIERYAFQTAQVLRAHGYSVDFYGTGKGRGQDQFAAGFDRIVSEQDLLQNPGQYALAAIHKIPALPRLKQWRAVFGAKLVFWAHDHDAYCPRHHYYTFWKRTNCSRAYHCAFCTFCALCSAPKQWNGGFFRRFKNLTGEFPHQLEILRGLPTVVLSNFMRNNLIRNGFQENRIFRIPPFVTPGEHREKSFCRNGILHLIYAGQLIRGKGVDLLLNALALVTEPFQLTVVGDGADRAMLEKMAHRLHLEDKITFSGWQHNPDAFFREADLAVLPFRWQEPFGLIGIEALANQCPLLAFDLGGCSEYCIPNETGFSIPPGDLKAFAETIQQTARAPERLKEMADNGYRLVNENFTEESFLCGIRKLKETAK